MRFIEVKSVSRENIDDISHLPADEAGETAINPEENMHPKKMERMARTVELYLAEKGIEGDWQMDLLCVFINEKDKKAKVRLWKDIVL